MRKVIIGAFVSLDGVMQAPGGPHEDPTMGFDHGGWVAPLVDDVLGETIDKMFGKPFDLLLGRKTYEIFAVHWSYAEGGPDDSIARIFNAATKYVATRKGLDLTWKGSVALGNAAIDVARLKQEDGPPLLTQGSTVLIQSLLADDLVERRDVGRGFEIEYGRVAQAAQIVERDFVRGNGHDCSGSRGENEVLSAAITDGRTRVKNQRPVDPMPAGLRRLRAAGQSNPVGTVGSREN